MTTDDDELLITTLEREAGAFEIARVTAYQGARTHPTEGTKSITVEVLDRGPGGGEDRWNVLVSDGERHTGMSGPTLKVALSYLRWHELDGS